MRRFLDRDYKEVSAWMTARGLTPVPYKYLPKTGLIDEGTAVGFLIETDARIGILDFFCSNPLAPKPMRVEALNGIARVLIQTAKSAGMNSLICNTKYENIKQLAKQNEFTYLGEFSSFYKEL